MGTKCQTEKDRMRNEDVKYRCISGIVWVWFRTTAIKSVIRIFWFPSE